MKGKLIVFEGGDGAGKKTQTDLLINTLQQQDEIINTIDFPRYDANHFGKLIGEALQGKFGDWIDVPPELAALPYALDRFESKTFIEESLKDGCLVSDRYVTSNVVFQATKVEKSQQDDLIAWIEKVEYEILGLPKPDVVIFLETDSDVAQGLLRERGDLDESDVNVSLQERVLSVGRKICKERDHWHSVLCVENGEMLSPEIIHQKVLDIVYEYKS